MREIKFRALLHGEIEYINDLYWFEENFIHSGSDCQLMQFTGLKDKNCVDIYEGDVVTDHVGTGVVEYIDDRAAFRVNYKNGYAKWFIDYLSGEFKTFAVIGNLYETPELLEDSK